MPVDGTKISPAAAAKTTTLVQIPATTTPVSARRSGDTVVIALTFGNQSDWSRNVRSAGGGSIRVEGEDCDVTRPQIMSRQEAKPQVS